MNFGSGDESSDSAAALDETFVLQGCERVTRGHKADLVEFRKIALGRDWISRTELSHVDAFSNRTFDALVSRNALMTLLRHAKNSSTGPG
jgi:hypothetical protein